MHNIFQRLNRLLYAITLILFLLHPFNIIYYFIKGKSFFIYVSKLLPYDDSTIALAVLLIFPLYLLFRWVLTGRFTIKPAWNFYSI
jgi:hypothetical protein